MTTLDLPINELVKRYQAGEIPASARATVTYDESEQRVDPALALVREWLAQAPTSAEEIQTAEEDLRDFQKALNNSRKEAGARILYPSVEEP